MNASLRPIVTSLVLGFVLALPCRAQCLEWDARFAPPGTNAAVNALVVFDDGFGPDLYVGGDFTGAGDASAAHIVRWDGVGWSALGSGVNGPVHALTVFDDGTGPALYAGGNFTVAGGGAANRIAKWNGATWSPLSTGMDIGIVFALAAYDDGTGPALFAGGVFTTAGGTIALSIAKWNGASWSNVGSGVFGTVYALSVYDDGSGPALFVGGEFAFAGGIGLPNIAKWNGASWSGVFGGVQTGPGTGVYALQVFDDGSGELLYVGGRFATAGFVAVDNITSWDGSNWSDVGGGMDARVSALCLFDDGSGSALFAGGDFLSAGAANANHAAKWNGSAWTPLDGGTNDSVRALAGFGDGSANALYAGGLFLAAGGKQGNYIAKWAASSWSPLDDHKGLADGVYALTTFDAGSGNDLYAGGKSAFAGEGSANHVAMWDGASWFGLAEGVDNDVYALTVFDDGSGSALIAGGVFDAAGGASANRIASWSGSSWSALGEGMSGGPVYALATFDAGAGALLYAGGGFTSADGLNANRIAKWNGLSWTALGSGLQGGGAESSARALAVFDDGSGPALYVGGIFVTAGVATANNIARWNGTAWRALGTGTNGAVRALAVFNDGTGAALYAGGDFTLAGNVAVSRVARWNGTAWTAVGGGTNDSVNALTVFSDGTKTSLIAGGDFTTAGTARANHVARWDGMLWRKLAEGVDGGAQPTVNALAVFEDGADLDADLYVGGFFTRAGDFASAYIAEWHGCAPGNAYCFGDGLDPVVTAACPCGNYGAPGHGCANSNGALGGAQLSVSGSTIPNTIRLTGTGIPNNALSTFLRASQENPGGAVFGDGISCLQGSAIRFGSQNAGQNGNPPNTVSFGAATVASGNTRYYQLYYRNVSAVFCTPETFNVSNGYVITW